MPRHEFIVKRVPKERLSEPGHAEMSKLTVAAFRSHLGEHIQCHNCDELLDASVLDQVWEEWGPDAVITFEHSWVREPNDPLDLRPTRPKGAQCKLPPNDEEGGASPSPGGK